MRGHLALQELHRRAVLHARAEVDTRHAVKEGAGAFLRAHLFDKQTDFVLDTSPQVAACCSRRAGKSFAVGTKMLEVAKERDEALIAYITPTRVMAKRIMWKVMKKLCKQYQLNAGFHEVDLEVRLPNGSVIMLLGADKESDIGKIRGLALDLAVLDEAQHFRPHIESFVEEDLGPTLADHAGQIYVTGTPKRMRSGFFYEVTTGRRKGWSNHHWRVLDNSRFPRWAGKENWAELAEAWQKQYFDERNLTWDMPAVKREWGGQWVEDETSLVYPYNEERNSLLELPPAAAPWEYGLGLDLGIMALVVAAWNKHDPHLYYVHAEKHKWSIDQLGARASELRDRYGTRKIIADCGALGTHIVNDLRTRFGLVVEAAEKQRKSAYQSVFASEMLRGMIKVLPHKAAPLVLEWQELQQDEAGNEDKHGKKDCADAALYIWRASRHYKAEAKPDWLTEYEGLPPQKKWEVDMEKQLELRAKRKEAKARQRRGAGFASNRLRSLL